MINFYKKFRLCSYEFNERKNILLFNNKKMIVLSKKKSVL